MVCVPEWLAFEMGSGWKKGGDVSRGTRAILRVKLKGKLVVHETCFLTITAASIIRVLPDGPLFNIDKRCRPRRKSKRTLCQDPLRKLTQRD